VTAEQILLDEFALRNIACPFDMTFVCDFGVFNGRDVCSSP